MLKSIANIILLISLCTVLSSAQGLDQDALIDQKGEQMQIFKVDRTIRNITSSYSPTLPQHIMRQEFSADDLPIFCKLEHKLAIRSGVNFKFRLGSIDYVDKLEGK